MRVWVVSSAAVVNRYNVLFRKIVRRQLHLQRIAFGRSQRHGTRTVQLIPAAVHSVVIKYGCLIRDSSIQRRAIYRRKRQVVADYGELNAHYRVAPIYRVEIYRVRLVARKLLTAYGQRHLHADSVACAMEGVVVIQCLHRNFVLLVEIICPCNIRHIARRAALVVRHRDGRRLVGGSQRVCRVGAHLARRRPTVGIRLRASAHRCCQLFSQIVLTNRRAVTLHRKLHCSFDDNSCVNIRIQRLTICCNCIFAWRIERKCAIFAVVSITCRVIPSYIVYQWIGTIVGLCIYNHLSRVCA